MSARKAPTILGAHFSNASTNPLPANLCCLSTPSRILPSQRGETLYLPRRRGSAGPPCGIASFAVLTTAPSNSASTRCYQFARKSCRGLRATNCVLVHGGHLAHPEPTIYIASSWKVEFLVQRHA